MNEETSRPKNPLKLPELEVSSEQPWGDDALGSQQVAESLTALVSNETGPLTISLDGHWGTGKTFLLKRWQKDLEKKKFKSIYFNAWEDDFCADPLVAIIGQLSNFFQDKDKDYEDILKNVLGAAKTLVVPAMSSVVKLTMGIDVSEESLKKFRELSGHLSLNEYSEQIKSKEELKKHLKKLSNKVKEETGHPLVFIIDELDRCRPTFAIELLERVKHIFDIPNMIFVFGINRKELLSALESIYGEIDSDVYLRRFFDMKFLLPETDSESFCKHLIKKYKLDELFYELSKQAGDSVHREEFQRLSNFFPKFCSYMKLSLRDIDYCVRAIVFTAKKVKKRYSMFPELISILIVLRLKEPVLFLNFKTKEGPFIEIMNYIHKEISVDKISFSRNPVYMGILSAEVQIYMIHMRHLHSFDDSHSKNDLSDPIEQLESLRDGKELTHPEYLSDMIKGPAPQPKTVGHLIKLYEDIYEHCKTDPEIDYILTLVELAGTTVQK